MKPTVIIKRINNKYILSDEQFKYIVDHLNKPLPLADLWWSGDGELRHLSIHTDEGLITLFDNNDIKGELLNGIKFRLG